MIRRLPILLLMFAACSRAPLPGDAVPPTLAAPTNPIEQRLFEPELVMAHQSAIGLQGAQRDALVAEVDRGQSELSRLTWELSAEQEKLAALLDAPKADEAQVLAQADRVLAVEAKVKRAHLGLLVRLKNALSPEQQRQLASLRGR